MNTKINFMTTPESGWDSFLAGKPFINTERNRLTLQFSPEAIQSEMFVDEPDKLSLDYTQKLMAFLLFNDQPKNITIIGLGGGSLSKYCYNKLPFTKIETVEINADVIAMREHFFIPADNERFFIHCLDGAKFIAQRKLSEDIIIVDGFDVGGQPPELCSKEFYDSCYAALSENGILAINLADSLKKHPTLIGRIRRSFFDAMIVINTKDCTNKIVLAFKNKNIHVDEAELSNNARELEYNHNIHFRQIVERILVNRHNEKIISRNLNN